MGLVYDQQGERLIPTHATKDNRRYRYYVSKAAQIDAASDGLRVAAADLEQIVTRRLQRFLAQRSKVFGAIAGRESDGNTQRLMLERAARLAEAWPERSAADHRALLQQIVAKILVRTDAVDIHLRRDGVAGLLGDSNAIAADEHSDSAPLVLTTPVQLMRWKKEVRLLITGAAGETEPNPALIRLIVRAAGLWTKLLQQNITITALAQREGVTGSYVTRLVRLACLAPDITTAILNGQQPAELTADKLIMAGRLPLAWTEQRQALGFN